EQRRLPGVRVADERREVEPLLGTRAARALALLGHRREPLLEVLDPAADDLAIALELRLTGTAGVDPTTEPGHLPAHAGEPRHAGLHLCQILLTLASLRRTVSHSDLNDPF